MVCNTLSQFWFTVKSDLTERKASEQRKCDGYGGDSLQKLTLMNEWVIDRPSVHTFLTMRHYFAVCWRRHPCRAKAGILGVRFAVVRGTRSTRGDSPNVKAQTGVTNNLKDDSVFRDSAVQKSVAGW